MRLAKTYLFLKEPAVLVIISAFGIYVTSFGVRVEHLVVYLLFGISILFSVLNTKLNLPSTIRVSFYLFAVFIIYSGLLWLMKSGAPTSVYVLGQIDRFILPIAVIIAISYFYRGYTELELKKVLKASCEVLLVLATISGLLVFVHLITNDGSFLQPFKPPGETLRGTVVSPSLSMGRYTGIFSLPFESGLVYSLSLFSFAYLYICRKVKIRHYVMSVIIVFAALLAVSKAFILGLVLFLLFIMLLAGFKNLYKIPIIVGLFGITGVYVFDNIYSEWDGLSYLMRLMPSGNHNDMLSLYTAGRFTTDGSGTIESRYEMIITALPFGFGFSDVGIVDNAYLEVLLIGGIVGFLFLTIFFAYYLRMGIKNFASAEGKFLVLIIFYSIIASLGAPAITNNRYSVIFFTIFVLIGLIINAKKKDGKTNN